MLQLDLSSIPSTSTSYDPALPLDCSKRAAEAESGVSAAVPPPPVKRKKISYAIEDLLKKDDS